jgi:oxygen-dependent protoporphyrinogen oxidase
MSNSIETQVTVVGAGISGLTTAFYLQSAGLEVEVLEKSPRVGGTIDTRHKDGYLIDCGPNSALETTPLLGEMFASLDIEEKLRYASDDASNRYIVRYGRLIALPMTPPAFFKTPLFSAGAKLRLLKEPFVPPSPPEADEDLASFVERRLGREMLDYAINPFVSGVYAGRPEALSVRAAFPRLHEIEQTYGSLIKGTIKGRKERRKRESAGESSKQSARMFSFAGGMQTIVDALGERLGESVRTSVTIDAIRRRGDGFEVEATSASGAVTIRTERLLLSIPAYAVSSLPFEFDVPVADALGSITYPPVTMIFLGFDSSPGGRALDGFGFLVPEKEKRRILGTIWSSTLFENRAPVAGAGLTTFVGGARQPELASCSDEELTGIVLSDLRDLMGVTKDPDLVYIRRWPRAIPQYAVGHLDIVKTLEGVEAEIPGLHITGNFRGGISVSDCVKSARSVASAIAAAYSQ